MELLTISLWLVVLVLFVGALIGTIGIGGVLLVPALTYLGGVPVHHAIPVCMLSFLASGVAGAIIFAKHGSIRWGTAYRVCMGAIPGAFLGATTLLSIPAVVIQLLIAGFMIFAGWNSFRKSKKESSESATVSDAKFIIIGFVTGFGSAITGTGGPLMLVPALIWFGLPVLAAIGLSQVIQIPISVFATTGYWLQDNLDVSLGLSIAVIMVAGVVVGATLVHRFPTERLKNVTAACLVIIGTGIVSRIVWDTVL